MKNIVLTLSILIISTSCALMDERSYYTQMSAEDNSLWVPNRDFPVVSGDNGRISRSYHEILSRSPASFEYNEFNKYDDAIRTELVNLENRMTDEDFDQYSRVRHKFQNDSERVYFLKLHPRERFTYLSSRGFYNQNYETSRRYVRSFEVEKPQAAPVRQPAGEWMPRENDKSHYDY